MSWCIKGFIWMLKMALNVAGCLGCLSMHKLCLDTPTYFYGCPTWPSMQLDVYQCTSCALKQRDWYGSSRWLLMHLDVLDECTSCVLMHQGIYMDAKDYLQWCWMSWMSINAQVVSWCTNTFLWRLKMRLDVLDVNWSSSCALMCLIVALCTWMHLDVLSCSLMYLDVSWCTWL